jgi:ornithine carbamoyltransferase
MKDFISLLDYSHDALIHILDRADELYDNWQHNRMPQPLANQQVGLWFYGQGFRNRLAFEIGGRAMGAQVTYIPGEIGVHEPLEDIGAYLENWFTLLVVRAAHHTDLTYLADHTSIPVINARTEISHPCEIMGDLQFIRRHRGSLDGLKVAFVGEVSNLCMSWLEAAVRLPITVTQVAPEDYFAAPALVNGLNAEALGHISTSTDLTSALQNVDLIYTDCWPKTTDAAARTHIRDLFLPYQITAQHLATLKQGSIFLPCPPVTRGEEVSDDAMLSPLCLNYDAKNFLLHAQNAIMEMLIQQQ